MILTELLESINPKPVIKAALNFDTRYTYSRTKSALLNEKVKMCLQIIYEKVKIGDYHYGLSTIPDPHDWPRKHNMILRCYEKGEEFRIITKVYKHCFKPNLGHLTIIIHDHCDKRRSLKYACNKFDAMIVISLRPKGCFEIFTFTSNTVLNHNFSVNDTAGRLKVTLSVDNRYCHKVAEGQLI